jgi:hypothetical protein
MIRKMYGLTFREKYRRVTRDIPIIAERKFRVIDEALFEDMVNDSVLDYLFRMAAVTTTIKSCTSRLSSMPSTSISKSTGPIIWEMDSNSLGPSRCSSP